jgi:hypothetical protein
MYTTYKWDEGYSDDVMNDLMVNAQKLEDLLVSMTERDDNIEESAENLNKLLIDIFEKYSKCESKFKEKCENCIQSNKQHIRHMEYKPWFTEDCKELYRQYQQALDVFNKNSNEDFNSI